MVIGYTRRILQCDGGHGLTRGYHDGHRPPFQGNYAQQHGSDGGWTPRRTWLLAGRTFQGLNGPMDGPGMGGPMSGLGGPGLGGPLGGPMGMGPGMGGQMGGPQMGGAMGNPGMGGPMMSGMSGPMNAMGGHGMGGPMGGPGMGGSMGGPGMGGPMAGPGMTGSAMGQRGIGRAGPGGGPGGASGPFNGANVQVKSKVIQHFSALHLLFAVSLIVSLKLHSNQQTAPSLVDLRYDVIEWYLRGRPISSYVR